MTGLLVTIGFRQSGFLLAALLVVSTVGCTTPQGARRGDGAPQRSLIGLDDEPLTDVWKEWTPAGGPSTPRFDVAPTAFDYWQITDAGYIDVAWAALFSMLSEARTQTPGEYGETFRTLMTVLEEDMAEGERRLDVTFLVSDPAAPSQWEGLAVRFWREFPSGAAPSVSLLLRRPEGGPETPTEIAIWFFSGFEEAASMTMKLEQADGWRAHAADGIVWTTPRGLDGEPDTVAAVAVQTFWTSFTGKAYVENPFDRREEPTPTPTPQPTALGLQVGDRQIEQVFTGSVFAPRLTNFPPRQP